MLTIYLDTSALLKRYVEELRTEETRQLLNEADQVGTSVITQVEIASALARLIFSRSISEIEAERVRVEFSEDWKIFNQLQITSQVTEKGFSLARQFRLRAYDAVHLASALLWQESLGLAVTLATFDRELWDAAKKTGLGVWPQALV